MTKIKEWLSKLSTRERIIVAVTTAVFGLAAMDRLVYQAIIHQFDALDQEIQAHESQIRKNLRSLAARQRTIQEHTRYTESLAAAGSDEEETSRMLGELEGLARESHLALINMKPQQIVPLGFGKRYAVEIEVRGEMAGLIQFLYALRHSKSLLSGEQFRLTNDKAAESVRGHLSITKTVIS